MGRGIIITVSIVHFAAPNKLQWLLDEKKRHGDDFNRRRSIIWVNAINSKRSGGRSQNSLTVGAERALASEESHVGQVNLDTFSWDLKLAGFNDD